MELKLSFKWTEEDRLKLLNVTQQCKDVHGKVNWARVLEEYPDKRLIQIKSQYQKITDKGAQIYHKWSYPELALLIDCVAQYGKDWALIQKHYFPKQTYVTIVQKYMHVSRWFKDNFEPICESVKNEQLSDLSNVPKKILKRVEGILNVINNRMLVMRGEKLTECTDIDRMFGCDNVDPLEIKYINEMSKKYDIQATLAVVQKYL